MRILEICGQFADSLRTVCGQFRAPSFVSRGSKRGVGEKIRGPREINLGQNQHFRPTFFGARYQKKALGEHQRKIISTRGAPKKNNGHRVLESARVVLPEGARVVFPATVLSFAQLTQGGGPFSINFGF